MLTRLLDEFPSYSLSSQRFIDSHCHLDFEDFDADRDAVMARAVAAGVEKFLVPGITHAQWPRLAMLAQQYPSWRVAYGLHPYFLDPALDYEAALQELPHWLLGEMSISASELDGSVAELAATATAATVAASATLNQPAIALGEIGLDASKPHPELQRFVFEQQLNIAAELAMPVILHHRKTLDEMLAMVRKKRICGGIVHAFSGSYEQAQAWVDAGFRLGVGGVITYERARKTRAAIARMPHSALVLETDSPDMPLSGQQGRRNEPANIARIAREKWESVWHEVRYCSERCRRNKNKDSNTHEHK